jgi:uncharacterized membrane protein YeiH
MGNSNLLLAFDLIGIFVFAVAGALAAVEKDLDIFGLVVVAGVSGIGGGLIRDVLLGITPPAAFRDSRYLITPAIAAVLVFYLHRHVDRLRVVLMVLDAAGLALFTAAGVERALRIRLGPFAAIGIGVIAAVGGGVLRDILLREIPVVLRKEIYAVAAVIGAVVLVIGSKLEVDRTLRSLTAIGIVFGIRVVAVQRAWDAPRPKPVDGDVTPP